MAKEQQARKATAHIDLHEQAILDQRLSQLEVGTFIIGLFCLFVFGAVFLNNQILKNHTVQMTSRAQSVADWIEMQDSHPNVVSVLRVLYPRVFRIWLLPDNLLRV